MTDLNIPKMNMNSEKYIFKKKLSIRRKSNRRLFIESALMLSLSFLLVYLNYLIPNKNLLLQNLPETFNKSFMLIIDLLSYLYQFFLVIFILISLFSAFILLVGSFYRLFRVYRRKTKQIVYK